ncbi:TIGR04282 family arsenosugar biosynthesis glycosyltransferase [Actinomycetospora chlora]|uniref:TIGR04282 family arsenosugar biosynthesis glycosyltransferase n=1 Tax=Actinomycetospora chlora TaxID=663608 RepID=UPI0031EAD5E4
MPVTTVDRVVLVLAKAPVAGRVKTRLTPAATPAGAAEVAAAALLDTLDAALAVPGARVVVALEGDPADAACRDELGDALARTLVVRQRGDSLGERIAAAHADVADAFPGAVSVQIGMDTPQVDTALLADALDLVATDAGAALGLALDGGWWALALDDPRRASLITEVPTSRDDTGRRTLHALRAGHPGLVLELPPLSDVDTPDDAVAVADLVPTGRFARAVADALPLPGGLPR